MRRWSALGIVAGAIPFLLVLWDLRLDPLRNAVPVGTYGNFFDTQARAILRGDLSVPQGSLGIEEFVVDGRSYMYFPPFPALLRIPVLVFGHALDGRLTAPSMLAGWFVFAVAVAMLIWTVRRRLRGADPVTRAECAAAAVLIAVITGGSSMLYIAALPYVFHEVYVWSAAGSIATIVALLLTCERPTVRRIAATGAFATVTILTRAPAGWALALTVVAVAVRIGLSGTEQSRRPFRLLTVAGIVPIVVGSAVNWAKFRHPYRFSIGDQVWSTMNPARQATLAANAGRIDGMQFLQTTMTAYFRPDGIRFVPYFPFVTFPAHPPSAVGRVVLDQTFRTGSITAFMPLLLVATIIGVIATFRPGGGSRFAPIRLILLGCLLTVGAVLAFAYISYRYTADFLPLFCVGAAVAFATVGERWTIASRGGGRLQARLGVVAALAVYSLYANFAVAVAESRITTGDGALHRYVEMRSTIARWIGHDGPIVRVDALPRSGSADEIAIVGDCAAMYINSGQTVDPWVAVEVRGTVITIETDRSHTPASLELVRFRGVIDRVLVVERDEQGRLRFVVRSDAYEYAGDWVRPDQDRVRAELTYDLARRVSFIHTSVDFEAVEYVTDRDSNGEPVVVSVDVLGGEVSRTIAGMTATASAGAPLDLCPKFIDEATPRSTVQ